MAFSFLVSTEDEDKIGKDSLAIISTVYSSYLPSKEISIDLQLVTKPEIQALNKEFRELDEPTDVLSFPVFDNKKEIEAQPDEEILIGSIVICPEKALEYKETLPQLVHHGLLHLLGYDHETDFDSWYTEEVIITQALQNAGLIIPIVTHDN